MYNSFQRHEESHAYGTAPIAALYEDCLGFFERLRSIIETDDEIEDASDPVIEGSFSKFRQWGSDTGAPNRSLDHALRKASQLQEATKDLLRDLLSALQTRRSCPFFLSLNAALLSFDVMNIAFPLLPR